MTGGLTGGGTPPREEWGQHIDAFLDSFAQGKTGSRFVYIKNDGEVQIFEKPKDAEKQGFRPLHLDALYKMSVERVNSADATGSIAHRLVSRLNDPVVRGRYQVLFDLAVKPSTQWSMISQKMVSTLDKQLDQVTSFVVSSGGKISGVYFLQLPTAENALVVKIDQEGWGQFLATKYFDALDIPVPNTGVIGRDTELGSKLITILSGQTEHEIPIHFSDISSQSGRFMNQVRSFPMILVMEKLDATSLESTRMDAIPPLLNRESFAQKLGEIIFLDVVIGNFDRLSSRLINLGNIMIDNDSKIILIDHNYRLETEKDAAKVKENLIALFDKNGKEVEDIVKSLLSNLSTPRKKIPISETSRQLLGTIDREALIQNLKTGIIQGRERFLQTFSNEDLRRGIFNAPFGNKALFDQIYSFIEELK
jgi:hypothetical protein